MLLLFCLCFFSYVIAVSSTFFLSQPVILTFCASSSPLHPATQEGEVIEQHVDSVGALN